MLIALAVILVACSAPVVREAGPPGEERLAALPEISGVLTEDRILDGEVVLAADLLVPAGRTLTLRPGTRVYIVPSESTKIDPEWLSAGTELLVRGRLLVEGSPEAPVMFVPTAIPEGEDVGWAGILLDKASARIAHAHIFAAESGVLCLASSPRIHASRMEGCRYGIIAQEKSAPHVSASRIEKGEGGVFCWRESTPLLTDNRIAGNAEEGLFVDRSSRPVLRGNEITGNAIGAALFAPGLLEESRPRGNGRDVVLLQDGDGR